MTPALLALYAAALGFPSELKAGGADEALIFGIVADGGQFLARVRFACRTEVEIEKCVPPGQQTGGFRRSVLSQLDGEGYRRGNDYDCQGDGEGAPNSHGMRSGLP